MKNIFFDIAQLGGLILILIVLLLALYLTIKKDTSLDYPRTEINKYRMTTTDSTNEFFYDLFYVKLYGYKKKIIKYKSNRDSNLLENLIQHYPIGTIPLCREDQKSYTKTMCTPREFGFMEGDRYITPIVDDKYKVPCASFCKGGIFYIPPVKIQKKMEYDKKHRSKNYLFYRAVLRSVVLWFFLVYLFMIYIIVIFTLSMDILITTLSLFLPVTVTYKASLIEVLLDATPKLIFNPATLVWIVGVFLTIIVY